jgi:putative SOS response-associated peptidase YedK
MDLYGKRQGFASIIIDAMCGRFTLTERDGRLVEARLGVPTGALSDYSRRYNIAPTQPYFVVVMAYENRAIIPAKWGLVPRGSKDASRAAQCINARSESVESRPAFRDAFRSRRCVVPADGFYEWSGPRTARQPHWIHRRDGQLLLFAGLYEEWQPAGTDAETTFTILTCAANSTMAHVHDRMPVILSDREADDWMNPREAVPHALKRMLLPAADDVLEMRAASPLVNNVRNEGPELLESSGLLL